MSKLIEHKDVKQVFMTGTKEEKDKVINEMAEILERTSNKVLGYNPLLISEDRQDIIYQEDGKWMWKVGAVKMLPWVDMQFLLTLLEKRSVLPEYRHLDLNGDTSYGPNL